MESGAQGTGSMETAVAEARDGTVITIAGLWHNQQRVLLRVEENPPCVGENPVVRGTIPRDAWNDPNKCVAGPPQSVAEMMGQ